MKARSTWSALRIPATFANFSASSGVRRRPSDQLSSSPSFDASLERHDIRPCASISATKRSKSSRCAAGQYSPSWSVTDGPTWLSTDTTM